MIAVPWTLVRVWRRPRLLRCVFGHQPPVLFRISGMQQQPMCPRCYEWLGEMVQDDAPAEWVNPRDPVCPGRGPIGDVPWRSTCGAPMVRVTPDELRRRGWTGPILRCTEPACGYEWPVPRHPH